MTNALYIAWRSGGPTSGHWGPVGRLEHGASGYRFVYTSGARTMEGFQPFSGMPRLDEVYESEELFPLFANRLLSPSRPEYEAYLTWGGFDPREPPDPLALLGVTEGMRQTDSFEVFPCPPPLEDRSYSIKFFLHGVRWMPVEARERISGLVPGAWLGLMPDLSNPYDANAVAVRTDDEGGAMMIGYVPRYLARDIRAMWRRGPSSPLDLAVERVNANAPSQQRLLCRLDVALPEGFEPCSGEEYQPLAEVPEREPCAA